MSRPAVIHVRDMRPGDIYVGRPHYDREFGGWVNPPHPWFGSRQAVEVLITRGGEPK